MKLGKNEWLVFGVYCKVDTFTGDVIIQNLKFKFNEKPRKNIENLIEILDYIDEKGYSLNVRMYNEFSKINLNFEISLTKKFIIKDIYITSLMIN